MQKSRGSTLTSYSEDIHGGKGSISIRRRAFITRISEFRENMSAEMLGNFSIVHFAVVLCLERTQHPKRFQKSCTIIILVRVTYHMIGSMPVF